MPIPHTLAAHYRKMPITRVLLYISHLVCVLRLRLEMSTAKSQFVKGFLPFPRKDVSNRDKNLLRHARFRFM